MLKKAAATAGAVAMIFALGLGIGLVSYRWLATRPAAGFSGPALLKKVQTLSELVTVKYNLEKAVVFDDAKWYGDSRVVLVAQGVVKAGIDVSRIAPQDVEVSGARIRLALPRPRITDAYLDDRQTQIVDRTTGIMRVFDKDLEQSARRQAVEELRAAALQNGILNDATDRARLQVKVLLYELGFKDVQLRDK
jgi:hypothetical protein